MKKIIIAVAALNFGNSVFADVNGKWLNTGNDVINLNHVGHISHGCSAESGSYIKFHRSIGNTKEVFRLGLRFSDCEGAYEDLVDFLDDDDSYKHL